MGCSFNEKIGAFFDREMPEAERFTFEAHLKDCTECSAELQRLQRMRQLFAAAGSPEMKLRKAWSPRRNQGVVRLAEWMMGAAAAVIVICSIGLIRSDSKRSETAAVQSWERLAVSQQIESAPANEIDDPMVQVLMREQP